MCRIFNGLVAAADACHPEPKISDHGAYISTKQGFALSNNSNTRFAGESVPSVHAENRVVKIAVQSGQCLKGS